MDKDNKEIVTGSKSYNGKPIIYNITGIEQEVEEEQVQLPPPPPSKKKDKKKKHKKEKKKKKEEEGYSLLNVFLPVIVVVFGVLLFGYYQLSSIAESSSSSPRLTLAPFGSNTTSEIPNDEIHSHLYGRIKKTLVNHCVKSKQPLFCMHHVGNLTDLPKLRICLFRKNYLMINPTYVHAKKEYPLETMESSIACKEPKRRKRMNQVEVTWRDEFGYVLKGTFEQEDAIVFQMTADEFSGLC